MGSESRVSIPARCDVPPNPPSNGAPNAVKGIHVRPGEIWLGESLRLQITANLPGGSAPEAVRLPRRGRRSGPSKGPLPATPLGLPSVPGAHVAAQITTILANIPPVGAPILAIVMQIAHVLPTVLLVCVQVADVRSTILDVTPKVTPIVPKVLPVRLDRVLVP